MDRTSYLNSLIDETNSISAEIIRQIDIAKSAFTLSNYVDIENNDIIDFETVYACFYNSEKLAYLFQGCSKYIQTFIDMDNQDRGYFELTRGFDSSKGDSRPMGLKLEW